MGITYKNLCLFTLLSSLFLYFFPENTNIGIIFLKLPGFVSLPGGLFLYFVTKEPGIDFRSFLFRAFAVNISYLIILTVLLRLFFPQASLQIIYCINVLISITIFINIRHKKNIHISISNHDKVILTTALVVVAAIIVNFSSNLFAPLENRGYKIFSNEHYDQAEIYPIINPYIVEANDATYLLLNEDKGYFSVDFAIKADISERFLIFWNNKLLAEYSIPFSEIEYYRGNYFEYHGKGVVFFRLGLLNEKTRNLLRIKALKGNIHCSFGQLTNNSLNNFVFSPRMFDVLEIFNNAKLFLNVNSYYAHQPALGYYVSSLAFLFWGEAFSSLAYAFLIFLFLIIVAILTLIIDTKPESNMLTPAKSGNLEIMPKRRMRYLSLSLRLILAGAILYIYFSDYFLADAIVFGDALYTLTFLLFLYFIWQKDLFWMGYYFFLTSIIRFPGYLLCLLFLVLLFSPQRKVPGITFPFVREKISFGTLLQDIKNNFSESIKTIALIVSLVFCGAVIINIIYPAYLHGIDSWYKSICVENFGEEHYSYDYVFSLKRMFSNIFQTFKYSYFLPLLLLFNKSTRNFICFFSILPYLLLLSSVEYFQYHYSLPIVSVFIIIGLRSLDEYFIN